MAALSWVNTSEFFSSSLSVSARLVLDPGGGWSWRYWQRRDLLAARQAFSMYSSMERRGAVRKTLSSHRRTARGSRARSSWLILGGGVRWFTVRSHSCRGYTVFKRSHTFKSDLESNTFLKVVKYLSIQLLGVPRNFRLKHKVY